MTPKFNPHATPECDRRSDDFSAFGVKPDWKKIAHEFEQQARCRRELLKDEKGAHELTKEKLRIAVEALEQIVSRNHAKQTPDGFYTCSEDGGIAYRALKQIEESDK